MYFCCFICNLKLDTIYIKCRVCLEDICLKCFSNGLEKDRHENSHHYQVVNMERIQTLDDWNLKHELDLLDQIEACKDVFFLSETTDRKVKIHIEKWHNMFLELTSQSDTDETFSKFLNEFYSIKTVCKLKRIDSDLSSSRNLPLRPVELSTQFRKLNGYRAARGDFETELNDKFEFKLVADLSLNDEIEEKKEENELELDLTLAVIDTYNEVIRERYERKKFVREFGLLNECSNSNQLVLSQFSEQIKVDSNDKFLKQSQLLKYQKFFDSLEDYVKFVELYNHQISLVKRIEELETYRQMGIGRLNHVEPYKHVKLKRLNKTQSVYMSSLVACLSRAYEKKSLTNNENLKEWFKQMSISEKSMSSSGNLISDITKKPLTQYQAQTLIKHKNNPLQIENYPDFDKLNEDEKEFCRVSRIQPAVFLKVKTILMIENQKAGQCTYSRARKIAGIDVNKTRVIHSYMINNKLIRVTSQETS